MRDLLKTNLFIILTLFIVFLFRLPTLFEPYWYGDEGVYLTVGSAIDKGYLLYRDIYDNKTPLIYLLAALVNGNLFWFRIILMSFVLPSIFIFYKLSLKFFDNSKAAKVATILLSLATTVRLFEGNVTNSEILILLPTLLGFYLATNNSFRENPKELVLFISGILLSLSFLFKVPALFDFLVIFVFWVLFEKNKLINIKKGTILFSLGFIFPIVLSFFFFWSKGAFSPYLNSAFLKTVGYLSSWETGSHSFSLIGLLKSGLVIKALLALIITLLLWLRKKTIDQKIIFVSIWMIFSLFASTLSGRPYPHYLIQTLPPLSLVFGFFFLKNKKIIWIFSFVLITVWLAAVGYYRFYKYTTISYWQNFVQFTLGKKDKNQYFSYFNWEMPIIYKVAEEISASTQSTDKIFIWSDDPYLYPLAKRQPATRYSVGYHIAEIGNYSEVTNTLVNIKPKMIITRENARPFPQLEMIIRTNYFLTNKEGNFLLYIRKNENL